LSIAAAWEALAASKRGEATRALEVVVAATQMEPPTSGSAWFMLGDVSCFLQDADTAISAYETRRVRAAEDGDLAAGVDALGRQVVTNICNDRFEEAAAKADELEMWIAKLDAPTSVAYAECALGSALLASDQERATAILERAAARSRSVGNTFVEALAVMTLGWASALQGDLDGARTKLAKAMKMFRRLGDAGHEWTAIRYMAVVLALVGQVEAATRLIAAADAAGQFATCWRRRAYLPRHVRSD
jgi:tetratricopeptide (TPR) repeat protein